MASETTVPGLSYGVVSVIVRLAFYVKYRLVTDKNRRKDRRTRGHRIYRASIASHGKNLTSLGSTSFQSLCLWLACSMCSCSCHILLSQFTTLTIHNSPSLSLSAQDLPFPQIFSTIHSLPASGLTPRLYAWSVSSEHLVFIFSFFISLFCLVPCGRLS